MKGDRKSKAVKPESPNDVMANTMKMADDAGSKENLADGTEGTIHNLVSVSITASTQLELTDQVEKTFSSRVDKLEAQNNEMKAMLQLLSRGGASEAKADPMKLVLHMASRVQQLETQNEQLKAMLEMQGDQIAQLQRVAMPKQAGLTCADAKRAGLNLMQVKAAGYTCEEIRLAGYVEGLKAAGYTCEEAKAAGYLEGLAAAGYSCAEAKEAGFSPQECCCAGFTFSEGKACGYSWSESDWNGSYFAW